MYRHYLSSFGAIWASGTQLWARDIFTDSISGLKDKSLPFWTSIHFLNPLGLPANCPGYCWAKAEYSLDGSPACHRVHGTGASAPTMASPDPNGGARYPGWRGSLAPQAAQATGWPAHRERLRVWEAARSGLLNLVIFHWDSNKIILQSDPWFCFFPLKVM